MLMPVGKESLGAGEDDPWGEEEDADARPGTTKRKQYYYKRVRLVVDRIILMFLCQLADFICRPVRPYFFNLYFSFH